MPGGDLLCGKKKDLVHNCPQKKPFQLYKQMKPNDLLSTFTFQIN